MFFLSPLGTGFGLGLVFSLTFFKSKYDFCCLFNIMSCVCRHVAGAPREGTSAWLPSHPFMGWGRPPSNTLDKECGLERGQNGLGISRISPGQWVRGPDILHMISFGKPVLYASESFVQICTLQYFKLIILFSQGIWKWVWLVTKTSGPEIHMLFDQKPFHSVEELLKFGYWTEARGVTLTPFPLTWGSGTLY